MFVARWYEERRLEVLAEEVQGPRILDIGYAQMPNAHLTRGKERHVTGLDMTEPPASHPYDEALVGDATNAKELLDGRVFDSVVAGEFIEHLEEPYTFLRSIRHAIAPGGKLVLSTPNPLAFPPLIAEFLHDRGHFYTEDHTFYFLPRWVERMLTRSGYELVKKRGIGFWNPLVRLPWAPAALSYQVVYVARPVG